MKIFNDSEFFQKSRYFEMKKKHCPKIFLTMSGWAEPGCGKCKLSGYFYTCRNFLLVQKVAFTRAMQNLSTFTCAKCGHVHIMHLMILHSALLIYPLTFESWLLANHFTNITTAGQLPKLIALYQL